MITGRGRYVDDMVIPGMLYMAVVRSQFAHAKINSIDKEAALALPGIHGVFTGEDLDIPAALPMAWVPPGVEIKTAEHWPLARGEVKYVGQGVAIVLGEDKYARRRRRRAGDRRLRPAARRDRPREGDRRGLARSSTPTSAPTRRTSGRSAAATWTRPGPSPT